MVLFLFRIILIYIIHFVRFVKYHLLKVFSVQVSGITEKRRPKRKYRSIAVSQHFDTKIFDEWTTNVFQFIHKFRTRKQ